MREIRNQRPTTYCPEAFGIHLKESRKGQGWTLVDLEEKTGINNTSISRWENGEAGEKDHRVTWWNAFTLAKLFAGLSRRLKRPSDIVDWLGLIGVFVTEIELAQMRSDDEWQAGLASVWITRYQVPNLPTPYIERVELLENARRKLLEESDGRAPLVLVGSGGMGKSTLAAALAADRNVRAHLPDAVLWARLEGTLGNERETCDAVLHSWAQALGAGEKSGETSQDLSNRLARWLEGERALLVIDNAVDYDAIQPFLIAGQKCRTVITTRVLGLTKHLPVGCQIVNVGPLDEQEAEYLLMALLAERAKELDSEKIIDTLEAAQGRALAVRIIGGRVKMYGLDYVMPNVRNQDSCWIKLLAPSGEKDPEWSLVAAFSSSYDLMDSEDQRYYRELGQLPGAFRFNEGMFQAICQVPDRAKVAEILRGFVQLCLLDIDGADYRLQSHLFQYARTLLVSAGDWDPDHQWVKRYRGELVKKWRRMRPSVPRAPDATVQRSGGLRQWIILGIKEFLTNFRRRYEQTIVENWDPKNKPMERWIVLKHLELREQVFRERLKWLGVMVGIMLGALFTLSQIPGSYFANRQQLRTWYISSGMVGVAIALGIVWPIWLATMLMIDLHRLRNWR